MKNIFAFLLDALSIVVMFIGVKDDSIPAVLFGGMVLIANAVREGKE